MRSPAGTGATMYVLAAVAALTLLTFLFNGLLDRKEHPNRELVTSRDAAGLRSVTLRRNRAGHYIAPGAINGVHTNFLVDTGATDVAVPAAIAEAADLPRGRAVTIRTANGHATAYLTRVARLSIGEIEQYNVPASIVPNLPGGHVLLGMSMLKHLQFSQQGDVLVLRENPNRRAGPPDALR